MFIVLQYRDTIGLHNIHLNAIEYSNRLRGKFLSTLLFILYMSAINTF